jgi:hypothetical protein
MSAGGWRIRFASHASLYLQSTGTFLSSILWKLGCTAFADQVHIPRLTLPSVYRFVFKQHSPETWLHSFLRIRFASHASLYLQSTGSFLAALSVNVVAQWFCGSCTHPMPSSTCRLQVHLCGSYIIRYYVVATPDGRLFCGIGDMISMYQKAAHFLNL